MSAFKVVAWFLGRSAQTPEQGARTQALLAVLPADQVQPGGFYGDCVPANWR